jgi:hypothetical protein
MTKNQKNNQPNLEVKTQEILNELSKLSPSELKKLNLDLEIERLKRNILFNKLFSDDEPEFNLSTLILIGLQVLILIILILKVK